MSKLIVIVGATGTGKTTEVAKILSQVNMPFLIFDINNEEKYKPFRNTWSKSVNMKEFVKTACEKKSTCIVFEEATIFFSHASSDESIRMLMIEKRHTKNLLIFNFHSLMQVPLYILQLCDLLVMGKTIDNPRNVEQKFKQFDAIYHAYLDVARSQDRFVKKYVKMLPDLPTQN